jgi:hypothetical protein
VAFVGKDQLFRAEVGADEGLEIGSILLVSLKSWPRDLQGQW